jgi:L-ascorbate metabolism protein UlaG (beta-lactamase superfamily)
MQLFWHGFSSIRIEIKTGDVDATLLTDPYDNESGLRFPKTIEPDIVALTHQDISRFNLENVGTKPFIVSDPGEYEVKRIFVRGIQDPSAEKESKRQIIYRFDVEDVSVGFLGPQKRTLTTYEVEQLGDIDILVLPVGGGDVMDAKAAAGTISLVEPRVVVPIYYNVPGVKMKLDGVEAFCKQLGVCQRQDIPKLKMTKKDLPAEDMLIAVIERS